MLDRKAAVLLALRDGPSYGRELVRRVRRASSGLVRLSEGALYTALRDLRAARLVAGWAVVPGRRRGARERTYYELTVAGVARAELLASGLGRFARREPCATSSSERERMRMRLERTAEISEAMMTLRQAGARARRLS